LVLIEPQFQTNIAFSIVPLVSRFGLAQDSVHWKRTLIVKIVTDLWFVRIFAPVPKRERLPNWKKQSAEE